MGKVAKVALPIAAVAAGAYFLGPSVIGAASGSGAATGGTLSTIGKVASTAFRFAGPALNLVSGVSSLAGGYQGYQSYQQQAATQQQATAANLQLIENQRLIDRQRLMRDQNNLRGRQRVATAASGVTLGSMDDVFEDTAQQAKLDLDLLDYDASVERQRIEYNSAVQVAQYQSLGRQSIYDGIGGATRAGISFVNSLQQRSAIDSAKSGRSLLGSF